MTHTGVLAGPISGLKYETPTHRGLTGKQGEFRYEEGSGSPSSWERRPSATSPRAPA